MIDTEALVKREKDDGDRYPLLAALLHSVPLRSPKIFEPLASFLALPALGSIPSNTAGHQRSAIGAVLSPVFLTI